MATGGDALLCADFNAASTAVLVGRARSFSIYQIRPFGVLVDRSGTGACRMAQLEDTPLVALVGTAEDPAFSPRRLRLVNAQTGDAVADFDFRSSVVAVHLLPTRLVAVLETSFHVFDLSTLQSMQSQTTPMNATGTSAVNAVRRMLAISTHESSLALLDLDLVRVHTLIHAHGTALAAVAFNAPGTLVATASLRGTVIRVWNVGTGEILHEFRRGITSARVSSLAFDAADHFLSSTSDTDTVHVYVLAPETLVKSSSSGSILSSVMSRSGFQVRLAGQRNRRRTRCIGRWVDQRLLIITDGDDDVILLEFVVNVDGSFRLVEEHALNRPKSLQVGAIVYDPPIPADEEHDDDDDDDVS
ncbi:unnamed protein product (mitochondrion) [Plasmodiophora brassicae]|uniref:Anaphase-promoting complex subunit 4 WD40 domain-containing protein n=1 Tax=Plasmodiophora brassicae TaxID=37360 RepID=A0A0G4J6M7_PLABS|nr:hypothetical protein PBRA_009164 [Plasmodiophora brassicae]SPR01561.1 unnamed protein product [Plasmodiophora brassicae]